MLSLPNFERNIMIYLTKEWRINHEYAMIELDMRVHQSAEIVDEQEFSRLYDKKQKQFVDKEIRYFTCDGCDGVADFEKRLAQYAALSDEEKAIFQKKNRRLFSRKRPIKFDKEFAKKRFETEYNKRMTIAEELPQEILNEISDLRVFCLGYVTPTVRDKVCRYCQQKSREVRNQYKVALRQTKEVQRTLKTWSNFCYWDRILLAIREEGKDIYLDIDNEKYFDKNTTIVISNGKILEQEEQVYPYKKNVYASPYTSIIETELHRAGELYEVHFLLRNVDSTGKEKIWYLTIVGTNVEIES